MKKCHTSILTSSHARSADEGTSHSTLEHSNTIAQVSRERLLLLYKSLWGEILYRGDSFLSGKTPSMHVGSPSGVAASCWRFLLNCGRGVYFHG